MSNTIFKRTKKNNIILFTLIIIQLTYSIKTQEYRCLNDQDCLSSYNCIENSCIHKSLFPIKFSEIILMLFLSILSMIATSAGIGGGPVFGVMFSFVLNFSISQATPISNFMILVSSITTFIVGLNNKMKYPQMNFVDYKLVVVFCPMLLFGTKIGVILNKILPPLFLNLILVLLLSITSYKTYYNALKFKQMDEKTQSTLLDGYNNTSEGENNNSLKNENLKAIYNDKVHNDMNDGFIEKKLYVDQQFINRVELSLKEPADFENKITTVKKITNSVLSGYFDKSVLDIPRIKTLLLLELLMIADQVLEGGDKMPSILGIRRCSFVYWIIFCLFSLCCMYFTWKLYSDAKEEYLSNLKSKVKNSLEKSEQEDLDFDIGTPQTEKKIGKIFLMCIVAGLMGGMLGIGGGIVMAPLMLELGVNPQTTSSTSNFILIINSSTGFILFMLSGSFIYDYSIVFGVSCFLFSYYGGNYLNQYIARTKKNSLLIFFLFYVMFFSLIVLPINGISRAIYDAKNGINVFALNQFC